MSSRYLDDVLDEHRHAAGPAILGPRPLREMVAEVDRLRRGLLDIAEDADPEVADRLRALVSPPPADQGAVGGL